MLRIDRLRRLREYLVDALGRILARVGRKHDRYLEHLVIGSRDAEAQIPLALAQTKLNSNYPLRKTV